MPTLFKQLQTARVHEPEPPGSPVISVPSRRSSKAGSNRASQARVEARREFLRTTNKGIKDEFYTRPDSLPSLDVAYNTFQRTYPKFAETWPIDELRHREYFHLAEGEHVCMDYCGFGLFSYYQQVINKASSSFGLAYISANLPTHALYGAAEEGSVEHLIRRRVMDYLNISETEYSMVFTASRGSAFKLLAESYPFHLNQKLLTVYDFESEAVNWMAECAKQKGAKIMSACFKWPTLRIGTSDLKKQLQEKKRRSESAKGLFVFPVQSRMTGAKYSFQWMSQAQQYKWHVLLDVSALGPKDMDSLGLSLFRPDFIVSSFYKVFGTDPTGFGCLFIKNSAIHTLHNSSRARAVGMVRIVSISGSLTDAASVRESDREDEDVEEKLQRRSARRLDQQATSSFSGPYFTAAEPELKIEDIPKGNNRPAAKSWKRNGRITSDVEHSGQLTGHLGDVGSRVSEIEEERHLSEIGYGAKLTRSRYYSERRTSEIEGLIQGSEIEYSGQLSKPQDGERVNEFREMGKYDRVSEGEISAQVTDSQLSPRGRMSDIVDEYNLGSRTLEFQSFTRQGFSRIDEEDVEDQEIDEPGESGRYSRANGSPDRTEGSHIALLDVSPDGRRSHFAEDVVGLCREPSQDAGEIEAKVPEDMEDIKVYMRDEDLREGSSLDPRKVESEEIGEANITFRDQEHTSVEGVGEGRLSPADGEGNNDAVQLQMEGASFDSTGDEEEKPKVEVINQRLTSFAGRASFKRLTGKKFSDFQEMGVLGLVQKFQSINSLSKFQKDLEGTSEANSSFPSGKSRPDEAVDLLRDRSSGVEERSLKKVGEASREYLQPINPEESAMQMSVELEADDHSDDHRFPAGGNSTGNVEREERVNLARDSPEQLRFVDVSRRPAAGGNLTEDVEEGVSGNEDDSEFPNHAESTVVESKTEDMRESVDHEVIPVAPSLLNENVVEAALNENDSLALQQRLAIVRQRERERAFDRASFEGEDDNWSQDEEFPQENPMPFVSPTLGGKAAPPLSVSDSQVVAWETHDQGAQTPSPTRGPNLSSPQICSSSREYAYDNNEPDGFAQNNATLWTGQARVRSTWANSRSDMDPTTSSRREANVVDESGRLANSKVGHLHSPANAGQSQQYSGPFRGEEGWTPYESGEENYITILPTRIEKNWSNSIPETVSEIRGSGSQEASDIDESSTVKEIEKGECMPDECNFISPEKSRDVGDEERSFKSSHQSPNIKLEKSLPSVSTSRHEMATSWAINSSHKKGSSAEGGSFDNADFHDAEEQDRRNGPSDLRSNRTLSRDVNFEDDLFSARASNASEMFTSRRLSSTLAEDLARIDMQDSDEESFLQSQYYSGQLHGSKYFGDEIPSVSFREGDVTDGDFEDIPEAELYESSGREPILLCKGLDFADSLGLTKLNYRLRYLINWLVNSLLKLRHPGSSDGISLVRIYGPKVRYDRGAALSFNMFDWKGILIQPGLVQRLADRSNISLGVGRLCNIVDPEMSPDFTAEKERLIAADRNDLALVDASPYSGKSEGRRSSIAGKSDSLTIPVVTAALGFVTSFEDVYKLWTFLAKFLDADFVSKEVWRYHSLNQQTIVM